MSFQKVVNLYPAGGINGQHAGLNPVVYVLPVPVAGKGGVITGHACWHDPDNTPGRVLNKGTGAPLGIALRLQTGIIPCDEGDTVTLPEGHSVAVVTRGDLLVTAAAAVTAGQKIFAKLADGSLSGAAAGAKVDDYVETGWTVRESAAAGEIFHISNW